MADPEKYFIPKQLDAPPMMLIFEADTATIFLLFLMVGFMFESVVALLGFCLSGLAVARVYARLKSKFGPGVLLQLLAWYTPSNLWLGKKQPLQSHHRELIG
jgi:conjugal transfer pilus assembly protein TraL